MYNFLVCYDETNWESGTGYMPKERCYINLSDDNVKKTLSGRYCSDHIEQIKLYPCILSYEKVHEKDAYIARITDVRYLGNEVKISFNKVGTLPFQQLINLTSELGINMSSRGLTELDHTHWSIKDLDLYDELCKAGIEIQSLKKPIVFISYSWDDAAHRDWVKHLSDELEKHAIKTILDQVDLIPGDQLPQFMEHSITNSDYVLIICTPKYKKKADSRNGGVGYEESIITSDVLINENHRKYITILSSGTWQTSTPRWAAGKYGVNLSDRPYHPTEFARLVKAITIKNQN